MNEKDKSIYAMRHSLAHIMASAIQTLWPTTKFGVGPVVENGFYYDVDIPDHVLIESDLDLIENQIKKIVSAGEVFEQFDMPIDDAISWAKKYEQPYKLELLNDLKRSGTTMIKDLDTQELGLATSDNSKIDIVSFYRNGDFTDLCKGPHVKSTDKVGSFKLMRISGAYWRGDDKRPQMQRIYGIAFPNEKELTDHIEMVEEAKKRDHRKLGQELDLFVFSDLVGSGLPLYTPRGTIIREELNNYVQELRSIYGYQQVTVPHITKKDLYEKSGHWSKFADELFKINTREGHTFVIKPMNCPHHAQIYASQQRSYRDLPVRYRETTMVYRDEQSGELSGLSRVRSITQDDAHVFCRTTQIEEEISKIWDIIHDFNATFGMKLKVRLSLHDPNSMNSYLGKEEVWERSEKHLKAVIKSKDVEYTESVGDAAFYGPKIDFIGYDVLGREVQASTIQLDFGQPEGFDLTCINEEGERERVVMIHAAIMGSLERFMALVIEQTVGAFPTWLAPEQVRLVTVNQEKQTVAFAEDILDQATKLGIRMTVDDANESVGKKIRQAEVMKVPYLVVVGSKEIETKELSIRVRKDLEVHDEHRLYTVDEFLNTISNDIKLRVSKSSF